MPNISARSVRRWMVKNGKLPKEMKNMGAMSEDGLIHGTNGAIWHPTKGFKALYCMTAETAARKAAWK